MQRPVLFDAAPTAVKFNRQLTHNYPVPGTYVSSALMFGDLVRHAPSPIQYATAKPLERRARLGR